MTDKKNLGKRLMRFIPLYLMMIPGAVYLIINNYIPMTGAIISFKQFRPGGGIYNGDWVGLKWFIQFWNVCRRRAWGRTR